MIFATTFLMTTMVFNNKQIYKVKDIFCLIHKDLHHKHYLALEAVHLEFACMAVHDLFERGHGTIRL